MEAVLTSIFINSWESCNQGVDFGIFWNGNFVNWVGELWSIVVDIFNTDEHISCTRTSATIYSMDLQSIFWLLFSVKATFNGQHPWKKNVWFIIWFSTNLKLANISKEQVSCECEVISVVNIWTESESASSQWIQLKVGITGGTEELIK